MKKNNIIMSVLLLAGVTLVGCDPYTDEKPGGTATENVAGTWTVTFEQSVDEYNALFGDAADPKLEEKSEAELAALEWDDIYGVGKVSVITSNTAANVSTEMWLIDHDFWGTQIRCDVNYGKLAFSADDQEVYDGCNMTVIGGKILKGAATTPRGMPADSIIAYVKYSDDTYGFTFMKMSGYRYTGYTEDR